jgi:hypothetical protein
MYEYSFVNLLLPKYQHFHELNLPQLIGSLLDDLCIRSCEVFFWIANVVKVVFQISRSLFGEIHVGELSQSGAISIARLFL